MDLKVKPMKWMGNFCQHFEAVCQEVDGIVRQDAVKYLENRVQNVGGSVKRFYSDVVQDLLPVPPVDNSSKYAARSVAIAGVKDNYNNKIVDGRNPVKKSNESFQDLKAIDLANDQQARASTEHDCVNQVSDEAYADSLVEEDSFVSQEEVGDYHSRETSGTKIENLHPSIEKIAVQSPPQLMNSIPNNKEKESLEFVVCGEPYFCSSDSGCVRAKDNLDVTVEHESGSIVEKNDLHSSTSQMLSSTSLGEKESCETTLSSEPLPSNVFYVDTCGPLAEVSPAATAVSYEKPMAKVEPLCSKTFGGLYSKSLGSYSSDIESCKYNLDDVSCHISESSMVHLCSEPTSPVPGQIMQPQDGLVSSCRSQSMDSNDKSLVSYLESSMEDIQLNSDAKLKESCVFVDDRELYAVSIRVQKLRSYKRRIRDAIAPKKRIAKEYEQLAIWYGDTDMEPAQGGLSRPLLAYSSRTYADSKNLQVQQASETEWELL